MSEKIQPMHTEREAYVYIRQSTMQQVRTRLEGQRRQYDLRERAISLGFQSVIVIDEDLGRSGTGSVERPGFGRLLAAVCDGRVGAILALEASRLAREQPRLASSDRSLRHGWHARHRSRWRLQSQPA
jgi:DNA invertase Pin-like site-specific DNA recombinase